VRVANVPCRFIRLLTSAARYKKCQVAAAKEVGMGNPAEKNDRAPDSCIVVDSLPSFARIFFGKFGVDEP
jgi:hypothetical protein